VGTVDKENFERKLKISNRTLKERNLSRFDKVLLGTLVIVLVGMNGVFISAFGDLFGQEDSEKIALELIPGEIQEVEVEDGVYEVDILTGNGEKEVTVNQQGEVVGVEDEKVDLPITGNALEDASNAALVYIGEGRVTDSEIGDEEGYYEIEITLDSGREVDVHLDENFNVLSTEYD
jgi:uncharacterized membrane protein YkoI